MAGGLFDRVLPIFKNALTTLPMGGGKGGVDKYSEAVYTPVYPALAHNPLWNHKADCAFPSATQNEINAKDAQNLVDNAVFLVSEGANMPTVPTLPDL
jgi:glutamate dehydrogenase (NADP+)